MTPIQLQVYRDAVSAIWSIVGFMCLFVCVLGLGAHFSAWLMAGRP